MYAPYHAYSKVFLYRDLAKACLLLHEWFRIFHQESYMCHLKMIPNTKDLHFWREKITSLTSDLCTENPYLKMFLAITFLFVNRFNNLAIPGGSRPPVPPLDPPMKIYAKDHTLGNTL